MSKLYSVLSALVISMLFVLNPVAASPDMKSTTIERVTISLNTAVAEVSTPHGLELQIYCVVTGPGSTIDYDADCETVRIGVMKDMQKRYPLVAVDYVIDGESWSTI